MERDVAAYGEAACRVCTVEPTRDELSCDRIDRERLQMDDR